MAKIVDDQNDLHTAAGKKDGLSTVISLLEASTDMNYINQVHTIWKTKPVHFAAQSGSLETLQYLIRSGADLDSSHVNNDNLLYYATSNTDDVIQYITSPENKIIEQFNDGTTYFHAAIIAGRVKEVESSLKNNPSLSLISNIKGDSPLDFANNYGRHEIGKLLAHQMCDLIVCEHEDGESIVAELAAYIIHLYENENLDLAFDLMDLLMVGYKQIDSEGAQKLTVKLYCDFTILALRSSNFELAENNFSVACMYYSQMNVNADLTPEAKELIDHVKTQLDLCLAVKDWGYICKDVESDGECFYHSLVDQLSLLKNSTFDEVNEAELRSLASRHISENAAHYQSFFRYKDDLDAEFKSYISNILVQDSWVDHLEILALSRELNMTFVILANDEKENLIIKQANSQATLYFGYLIGLHYQSLHLCEDIKPVKSIDQEIHNHEIDNFDGVILTKAENTIELEKMAVEALVEADQEISISKSPIQFFTSRNIVKLIDDNDKENDLESSHVSKKIKLNG